jgi:dolichyl-diphosphooligosaccharide--protein glycosyltransferase
MSQEDEGVSAEVDEAMEWFKEWYHIPSLLLLVVFAFWVRARTWGNFVQNGEIYYSGNDAWYHLRQVKYSVRNWPETMPFEVWTNFPTGTSVSQFGTIYDQTVATVALVVGLGSPSQRTIEIVHLFAPAVVGALIIVPAYYLGKRLGKNRFSGVVAALIVALSTGGLLGRSLVGFSDHHVAEAFTQALAVLTIVVALQVADREKPVWELFIDRDVTGLRQPVGYAVLAGVATALYMWVWPPGVLLVGILGIYVTLQAVVDFAKGRTPEHTLLVAVVLFATTAVLMLLPLERLDVAPVKFSILHPGLALAGAVWSGLLLGIARYWDDQSYPKWTYPIVVFGILLSGIAAIALLAPNIFGLLLNQITRVFGFIVEPTGAAATVGEVSPLSFDDARGAFRYWYGYTHFLAIGGIVLALVRQTVTQKSRSELLFVSIWFVVIVMATLTQSRFSYYMTVPVAVMAAYLIGGVLRYVTETGASSENINVRPYQIMVVVTVLALVIAPMTLISVQGQRQDVITQSQTTQPSGVLGWDSSLDWLAENTPNQGNYADAGNTLDYWGEFTRTDDYDYPDGSYGVLSWWDYGHWITTEGRSIPVANPFQESATDAARFLLAQNETTAENEVLANMSEGEDAQTRYVMVDWKMATSSDPVFRTKFFAPPKFIDGVSQSTYYDRVYSLRQTQNGNIAPARPFITVRKQAYYETMVNRLYHYHGSAAWPDYVPNAPLPQSAPYDRGLLQQGSFVPVVHPSSQGGIQTAATPARDGRNTTRLFPSLNEAQAYVANNSGARIGGLGKYPSEHVPALEQYRLVHTSESNAGPFRASEPALNRVFTGVNRPEIYAEPYSSWTKTFERVPGATVNGTVPGQSNETVYATVTMQIPTPNQPSNQTFEYVQQAQTGPDGTFEMTLPYSTTGYENWGPEEGYTNVSVRAESQYTFTTGLVASDSEIVRYNATADVSERRVIGEDASPVEVTLTENTIVSGNDTDSSSESDGTNDINSEEVGKTQPTDSIDEQFAPNPLAKVRIAD